MGRWKSMEKERNTVPKNREHVCGSISFACVFFTCSTEQHSNIPAITENRVNLDSDKWSSFFNFKSKENTGHTQVFHRSTILVKYGMKRAIMKATFPGQPIYN
jgi:hypothetical protein